MNHSHVNNHFYILEQKNECQHSIEKTNIILLLNQYNLNQF